MLRLAGSGEFQSTLPVWGGTCQRQVFPGTCSNFNPPSPCGEGLAGVFTCAKLCDFNPPSPCGEGPWGLGCGTPYRDFNPPSPCGEGPLEEFDSFSFETFQSTLPVWGGT